MNLFPPAIHLTNTDGSLDLVLAGWQYPGATSGDGAYCLNVDGIVHHRRGDWKFRGEFCRMAHLSSLADWLDAVASGEKPELCLMGGFMSHELAFHVQGGSYHPNCYEEQFSPPTTGVFRVTFGGNTRPPWCGNEHCSMDFPIVGSVLRAGAAELRNQIRMYLSQ